MNDYRSNSDEYYAYTSTSGNRPSGSRSSGNGCLTIFCIMMIIIFLLETSGCAQAPTYEMTGKQVYFDNTIYLKAGANLRSFKANEDAKRLAEEEKKQEEEQKAAEANVNSTALVGGNGWRRTGAGSVVGSVKLPMGDSEVTGTSGSSTTTSKPAPAKPEKKPLDPYDVYDYDDPYEFADDWAEEFLYDEGFYDDIDGAYDYDDAYDDAWDFAYDYWWKKVKGKRY